MAARAIWKGVIDLGDGVPVKLYSAVEDRAVHFRLLHEKDRAPVARRMVHPVTGEEVPRSATLRGWETGDGRIVILDEEELEQIEPEASRDIEVLRFVEPSDLPHPWYDRPYFLGPDGDPGAWAALAAALRRTGLEGVVRWVMRNTRYLGALRLHESIPMLVTLRHAGEVVEVGDVEAPGGRALEKRELDMARRLVAMMEGPFDPSEWEDEHRARLRELIDAKAAGKTVSLGEHRRRREPEGSLEETLRASLEVAGGQRSA